ncbi:MAG: sensor histidine kinase [Hyphomonadaceae bacterium]
MSPFVVFNLALWLGVFVLFQARAQLIGEGWQFNIGVRRWVLVCCGFAVTAACHFGVGRLTDRFRQRVLYTALVTPLIALLCTTTFYFVLHIWQPAPQMPPLPFDGATTLGGYILENYPSHLFIFLAWMGLYLTYMYADALADRERRIMLAAAQAQRAELTLLRYQINPHFLFNTLNTISAQIVTGNGRDADRMLSSLSRFLRHSLHSSAETQTTLEKEIQTTKLYLEIEQGRFAPRLKVEFLVEDTALHVLVPSFLLQPLAENTIKYAVSAVRRPILLEIRGAIDGKWLHLSVSDDGPGATPGATPNGIGLANVRTRLQTLYGDDYDMTVGPRSGGGFAISMKLPARFASAERAA